MQLSIQAHAQQQAKELVQAWGERARVHIGDVRYHLLRNGLILRDIQIERGDDSIGISQMLLRANPKLLTGDTPRIGVINISGLKAEITHAGQTDIWQHDQYLKQIWQAATSFTVQNGNIKLYVNDKTEPPLELSGVSLQQRLQYAMRRIVGSARMQQGKVNWQWDMVARPGAPAPKQAEQWLSKGWLKWQGLDAEKLTASLALKQMAGHLSGRLTWETSSHGSEQQQSFNMNGDMRFDTGTNSNPSHAHRLQYAATETDGRWQMDIEANAWPLDPWSDVLPKIGERQLISAQMDGKTHWQGNPGSWNINSEQGLLQDVTYARADSSGVPAWYWSRIHYKHAAIQTAKHQLQLSGIDLLDSRLVLQTRRMDAATGTDDERTSAAAEVTSTKQKHAAQAKEALKDAPKEAGWDINADKINVRNMMLALAMPQGMVTLEQLDGQARSPKHKALSFKLHTHAENTVHKSTTPDGEEHGKNLPQWQLRGKAEKNSQGRLTSAKMKIRGRYIPVARLRPLLPLQDDADRPVKLAGEADLKAAITVDQGVWQMQGKASIRDLNLSHGGDVMLADQVNMRFGPVGMGLESQMIDSIDAQGWQYIAALHPLPLHVVEAVESNPVALGSASWWVTTLRNNHMAITRLNLEDGQISVGQQQALWADQVTIEAANIQAGQWSDITVSGEVGGSDFHLKGQWQALSDVQRFRGDVGLEQAEPFFLHNWMVASGMPRLIQGRLSASLHVEDGQDPDSYQGAVQCQLLRGQTETGIFTSDPMLPRTGYSTPELLQRLEQSSGVIALQYAFSGLWSVQPLTLERLGLLMQAAMHEAAQSGSWHEEVNVENTVADSAIEARIRLHDRERLSLNERTRLSVVVHKLRRLPKMVIVLRPKWKGSELTEKMLQRIRRTQQLIENYMTHRNIAKRRIFAKWPTAGDQVDEIGSVQVESRTAG